MQLHKPLLIFSWLEAEQWNFSGAIIALGVPLYTYSRNLTEYIIQLQIKWRRGTAGWEIKCNKIIRVKLKVSVIGRKLSINFTTSPTKWTAEVRHLLAFGSLGSHPAEPTCFEMHREGPKCKTEWRGCFLQRRPRFLFFKFTHALQRPWGGRVENRQCDESATEFFRSWIRVSVFISIFWLRCHRVHIYLSLPWKKTQATGMRSHHLYFC